MAGKADEAKCLHQEAWEARTDDYEACIVAHYLARVQRTPDEVLNWNRESLRYADAVNDERVAGFYPSLYLNMGKAYEDLGKRRGAEVLWARGGESGHFAGREIWRHGAAWRGRRLEAGGGMRASRLFGCVESFWWARLGCCAGGQGAWLAGLKPGAYIGSGFVGRFIIRSGALPGGRRGRRVGRGSSRRLRRL